MRSSSGDGCDLRISSSMSNGYDPRISIEGNGVPLVLVPGLNGIGELFYRQIPSLRQGYRVATYTLRDDAPTLNALADDLAQVIGEIAPVERRAIVVGESFGGRSAGLVGQTSMAAVYCGDGAESTTEGTSCDCGK